MDEANPLTRRAPLLQGRKPPRGSGGAQEDAPGWSQRSGLALAGLRHSDATFVPEHSCLLHPNGRFRVGWVRCVRIMFCLKPVPIIAKLS